jgi:hypothetical protein
MTRRYIVQPLTLLLYIIAGTFLAVALDMAGLSEGVTFAITMAVLGVAFLTDNLVLFKTHRGLLDLAVYNGPQLLSRLFRTNRRSSLSEGLIEIREDINEPPLPIVEVTVLIPSAGPQSKLTLKALLDTGARRTTILRAVADKLVNMLALGEDAIPVEISMPKISSKSVNVLIMNEDRFSYRMSNIHMFDSGIPNIHMVLGMDFLCQVDVHLRGNSVEISDLPDRSPLNRP